MALKMRSLGFMGIGMLMGAATFNLKEPALAALITTEFMVEITAGDLFPDESFLGSLVYDDSFLTGSGFEVLSIDSGLESLEFTYVGADLTTPVTYTAFDDIVYPRSPQLGFTDGQLSGLVDGLLYEVEVSSDVRFFFDGQFFGTDEFSTGRFNDGKVTYKTASVPEPISVLGIVAVGSFGLLSLPRIRSQN